jgi:hypothetical protein
MGQLRVNENYLRILADLQINLAVVRPYTLIIPEIYSRARKPATVGRQLERNPYDNAIQFLRALL